MHQALAAFRQAWAIRPVAAGEFYLRTGWSLLGIAAGFLGLLFLPVWFGDAEWPAYDPSLSIPLAVIPFGFCIPVLFSFLTPLINNNFDLFEKCMDFLYFGDYKKYTRAIGYLPNNLQLECRFSTVLIIILAILISVCHLWFDNQNSNAVSYYWAALALVTSCLLGGLAWYRHQIVSGDLLIIPDDWPE